MFSIAFRFDIGYKFDTDLIPKNSRVQIRRIVKNIGPALAGTDTYLTQKESELLSDQRLKQQMKSAANAQHTTQPVAAVVDQNACGVTNGTHPFNSEELIVQTEVADKATTVVGNNNNTVSVDANSIYSDLVETAETAKPIVVRKCLFSINFFKVVS